MNSLYGIKIKTENSIELLTGLVKVYCLSKQLKGGEDKRLRNKLEVLLAYYIKYGYNDNAKIANQVKEIISQRRKLSFKNQRL